MDDNDLQKAADAFGTGEKQETKNYEEAPASANVRIKSPQGFEWQFTIRDDHASTLLFKMAAMEKRWLGAGFIPVIPTHFQKAAPKPVDYIEGRLCPLDGGRLIKPPVGTNRPIKCENSKYNFQTKTSSGCAFTEWPKSGYEQDMERQNGY